jgi:hypothetical protein
MANEFVVKNGLISQGNITATGSLVVSQNISASNISASGTISASVFSGAHTGSTFGTSSWANNALTAALATSINFTASNATTSQTASYLTPANSYTVANLTASNINIGNFNNLSIGTSNQYHNIYLQKPLVAGANYHHLHLGTRWYWDFTANVWTSSSQPNVDNPDWTAIDSVEYLSFKVGNVTGSVTSLTTSSYDSNERFRISMADVRVFNSGSDAEFRIVENDSVNNPKLTFYNVTTPKWVVGVDAADSDKFKINTNSYLLTTPLNDTNNFNY